MKQIFYILLFYGLSLNAQFSLPNWVYTPGLPVPTTDLNFFWDGGINPVDSTLKNSITGTYDTNFKLLSFNGELTDDYISAKSPTLLKVYNDTTPITCLSANHNYADSLYYKMLEHTINADSTEILPYRLTEIAYYNEQKTGVDSTTLASYFNVPTIPAGTIWLDPTNGNDANDGTINSPYKTFADAAAATSSGGDIYIKSGDLNEQCYILNKGIDIVGVGDVKNTLASGSCIYFNNNGADDSSVKGIECIGDALRGVYTLNSGTSNTTIQNMVLRNTNPVRRTGLVGTATTNLYNCVSEGLINTNVDNLLIQETYIMYSTIPIGINVNYTSKHNIYEGSPTTILNRTENTTSITMFDDKVTGSILTEEADTTDIDILIDYCDLYPDSSGFFMRAMQGSSKLNLSITNSTINQTLPTASTGFYLRTYDLTFTGNTVYNQVNNIIWSQSMVAGKTFTFSNNNCYSDSLVRVRSDDYIFIADSNVMVSECGAAALAVTSINFDSIPARISNNYMASKGGIKPFVELGTEYTTDIDGHLNGSVIYNNKFSGPSDWGNDPLGMHALFSWSQQADWYNNYISGASLSLVFKSNGGIYKHQVYNNIINNCGMSYTCKGSKGAYIYNNISNHAVGYNSLAEVEVGMEGDGGLDTVVNNIFLDTITTPFVLIIDATDSVGTYINNNVYYNPNYSNIGYIGANLFTYSEWQGIGYDANSYNSDPNFNSATELWPITPTDADGNGADLGTEYNTILLNTSVWPDDINTSTQDASWDIGAFKIE